MNDGTKPQRRRQHQGREIRENAVAGLLPPHLPRASSRAGGPGGRAPRPLGPIVAEKAPGGYMGHEHERLLGYGVLS